MSSLLKLMVSRLPVGLWLECCYVTHTVLISWFTSTGGWNKVMLLKIVTLTVLFIFPCLGTSRVCIIPQHSNRRSWSNIYIVGIILQHDTVPNMLFHKNVMLTSRHALRQEAGSLMCLHNSIYTHSYVSTKLTFQRCKNIMQALRRVCINHGRDMWAIISICDTL